MIDFFPNIDNDDDDDDGEAEKSIRTKTISLLRYYINHCRSSKAPKNNTDRQTAGRIFILSNNSSNR